MMREEALIGRVPREAIVERDEPRLVIGADRSDAHCLAVLEHDLPLDPGRVIHRHFPRLAVLPEILEHTLLRRN